MNRKLVPLLSAAGAAALTLLFIRNWAPEPLPAIEAPPRVAASEVRIADPEPLLPLEGPMPLGASKRNLFRYREVVRQPVTRVASLTPIVVATPAPVELRPEPVVVTAPAIPSFPYTYLGRFGPKGDPIAVFKADGELVNARAGETIAGTYRVRKIHADGVEIGFVGSDHVVTVVPREGV